MTCVCCVVWPDNFIGDEGATALGPHLGKLVNMHALNLAGEDSTWACQVTSRLLLTPVCTPGCALGACGWRCILQALMTVPHIQAVGGLYSFVRYTTIDATHVLRGLQWPVALLQQADPESAILQFCREVSIAKHMGDPVASLLLLGPGGTGKSTLLHRLQERTWRANLLSTDGMCIGASRAECLLWVNPSYDMSQFHATRSVVSSYCGG